MRAVQQNESKDDLVQQLFDKHQESLVIYVDPDEEVEGESKIRLFMKSKKENSKLSALLGDLLSQLQRKRQCTNKRLFNQD